MAVKELKYATVDGVDIYMDVVVPEGATKEKKAPIYLWFVSVLVCAVSTVCDVCPPAVLREDEDGVCSADTPAPSYARSCSPLFPHSPSHDSTVEVCSR